MDNSNQPGGCLTMGQIMEFISSQRHEFLNHLQVVMGLLQLNKLEEAVGYIKKVSEGLQRAGLAARVPWPELAAVLTLRGWQVRESGGRLNLSIAKGLDGIARNPVETVKVVDEVYQLVCGEMQNCGHKTDRQLQVELFEQRGNYGIRFSWEPPAGWGIDKTGLINHPVLERARVLMSRVEMQEKGNLLTLTLFFPQGSHS